MLLCSVAWNLRLNITNIKIRLEWTAFFRKKKPSPSHCAKQLLVVRLFWKKKVVVKFIFCAIFSSFYFHFSTFTFLLSLFYFHFSEFMRKTFQVSAFVFWENSSLNLKINRASLVITFLNCSIFCVINFLRKVQTIFCEKLFKFLFSTNIFLRFVFQPKVYKYKNEHFRETWWEFW